MGNEMLLFSIIMAYFQQHITDIQNQPKPNQRKRQDMCFRKYFMKNEYSDKKLHRWRDVLEKTNRV